MTNSIAFPFQAIDRIVFNPRPQPLPASLRPLYRIALIILILKINCRRNTATLLKIQFLNWLIKSSAMNVIDNDMFKIQGVFILDLIHLDPMVNLALNYAFASDLVCMTSNSRTNPKYKLTDKGHKFANKIIQDEQSSLAKEREILERIGQKITEVELKRELL